MQLPRIDRFLATDSDLQPVVAKAREIGALSKLCDEFLPPELAAHLRPASLQGGKLVVLAANAAAAAKLKLLSESLGDFLSKRGAKVNSVSVKVQPGGMNLVARPAAVRSAHIPPLGFAALSELYGKLGDSPARRALERLLARESSPAGSIARPPAAGTPAPAAPPARKRARS